MVWLGWFGFEEFILSKSQIGGSSRLRYAVGWLVWFGLVWFGLVGLVGLVWFGLVGWFGLVCVKFRRELNTKTDVYVLYPGIGLVYS